MHPLPNMLLSKSRPSVPTISHPSRVAYFATEVASAGYQTLQDVFLQCLPVPKMLPCSSILGRPGGSSSPIKTQVFCHLPCPRNSRKSGFWLSSILRFNRRMKIFKIASVTSNSEVAVVERVQSTSSALKAASKSITVRRASYCSAAIGRNNNQESSAFSTALAAVDIQNIVKSVTKSVNLPPEGPSSALHSIVIEPSLSSPANAADETPGLHVPNLKRFEIYRWNPDTGGKAIMQEFAVDTTRCGPMVRHS